MIKTKKRHLILGGLVFIVFLFFFFLSTFVKNYLVKNSKDIIGRKVTLDELHINYFKVQIIAKDFTLYEKNEKDTIRLFQRIIG